MIGAKFAIDELLQRGQVPARLILLALLLARCKVLNRWIAADAHFAAHFFTGIGRAVNVKNSGGLVRLELAFELGPLFEI